MSKLIVTERFCAGCQTKRSTLSPIDMNLLWWNVATKRKRRRRTEYAQVGSDIPGRVYPQKLGLLRKNSCFPSKARNKRYASHWRGILLNKHVSGNKKHKEAIIATHRSPPHTHTHPHTRTSSRRVITN